jgi:hypothetical protein
MYLRQFFGKDSNITEDDLKVFLKSNKEGATIEFKASISNKRDALLEPITAFANGLGGLLILGVSDNGEPIGLHKSDTKEKISQIIRSSIEPISFSSANYCDIKEVSLENGKNVFLVDIRAPAVIVGFKSEGNYFYYVRKNNEKILLTPRELYDISLLKGTYTYNWSYRRRILNTLLHYEDFYDLLTNRKSEAMKYKIKGLILYKGKYLEKPYAELKALIMNTGLKTLSINTHQVLLNVYTEILDIRNTIKHKELSSEEDEALDELQEEYSDRFRLDTRPSIDSVYEASRNNLHHGDELSLEDYIYSYMGTLFEPYLKTTDMPNFIVNSQFHLWSYEENMVKMRPQLVKACSELKMHDGIRDHILQLYDEFPDTYLRSLIPLMHKLENYKEATNKALYLEDEDSDNTEP